MHVDLIARDWLVGKEVLLARIYEQEGELQTYPARWSSFIKRIMEHYPEEQTLEHVGQRIAGDYLLASEPHKDVNCPFWASNELRIVEYPAPRPRH